MEFFRIHVFYEKLEFPGFFDFKQAQFQFKTLAWNSLEKSPHENRDSIENTKNFRLIEEKRNWIIEIRDFEVKYKGKDQIEKDIDFLRKIRNSNENPENWL